MSTDERNRTENPDSRLRRRIPNFCLDCRYSLHGMEHLKSDHSLLNDAAVLFFGKSSYQRVYCGRITDFTESPRRVCTNRGMTSN